MTYLHRAIGGNELVLEVCVPQAQAGQVQQQVLVDDRELAAEHAADVDVARVRLKALVVPQDLQAHCSVLLQHPWLLVFCFLALHLQDASRPTGDGERLLQLQIYLSTVLVSCCSLVGLHAECARSMRRWPAWLGV